MALVAELLNSTPTAVVGHSTLEIWSTTKFPADVSADIVTKGSVACQTQIKACPKSLALALLSKAPKIAVQVSDPAVKVVFSRSGSEIHLPRAISQLLVELASAMPIEVGPVPLGASPSNLVTAEVVESQAPCQVEGAVTEILVLVK
jgi:hypothetical protein